MSRLFPIVIAFFCAACGPSVEDLIDDLGAGGEQSVEARQHLLLAKEQAVGPLLKALEDQHHREARPELVEVLASLMMRVENDQVGAALLEHLRHDPDPRVKARIARRLGLQKYTGAIEALIDVLGDADGEVRYQALVALSLLESKLIEAQKEAVRLKARELNEDKHEGVRMEATINVENYVNQWIGEARQLEVQAEIARAESLYSKALAYSPHSKQGNYRMGRFYLDNGEREKGLDLLRRHGMLLEVPPLAEPPTIDGRIDEALWRTAARADSFYQFANNHYAALPSEVETEVYIGYIDEALYIGFLALDENPDSLVVGRRPNMVWWDDDVEFYCDADFDHSTYCQIGFNSAGLVNDKWFNGGLRNEVEGWDAYGEAAVHVGADFWSVEYRLPVATDDFPRPRPGAIWGFNFVRVFRGSEYSQWVRTYGGNAHQPDDFGLLVFR